MQGKWTPTENDTKAGRVAGFGLVTNIINGGIECGAGAANPSPKAQNRVEFFKRIGNILRVATMDSEVTQCNCMQSFTGGFTLPAGCSEGGGTNPPKPPGPGSPPVSSTGGCGDYKCKDVSRAGCSDNNCGSFCKQVENSYCSGLSGVKFLNCVHTGEKQDGSKWGPGFESMGCGYDPSALGSATTSTTTYTATSTATSTKKPDVVSSTTLNSLSSVVSILICLLIIIN
eukprot:GHVR01002164.1.p2 GENE.GHVR01002164.1~~GHVR01002164.1.p2  ORF type:complete len:229 (+),score=32.45 GHVR01002164.1:894-1580(+)